MTKQFVPYEEALELKVLGFNEPCFGLYAPPSKTVFLHQYGLLTAKEQVLAPLWQQAFSWFREKYQLQGYIYSTTVRGSKDSDVKFSDYCWYINGIDMPFLSTDARDMEKVTYENAELACLRKLIEIAKEKQNV